MNRRRFQDIEKMFHFYYGRLKTETCANRTTDQVLRENQDVTPEEIRRFAGQLEEKGYKKQADKIREELDDIVGQTSLDFGKDEFLSWL
jgi:hypothetical protein